MSTHSASRPRGARLAVALWFAALALWFVLGCESPAPAAGLVREARLGVFYGGQIQEREQVPLVIDRSRQSQGFRLEFRGPLSEPVTVRWEIEMPGSERGAAGALHVAKLGELTVGPGQESVDQVFAFEPGDPVGLWNLRVHAGDELVIDQAWWVFDEAAGRRAPSE